MLILFDYYFYRSYTHPKEKDVRFFRSVTLAWAVCFYTAAIPISAFLTLFFKHDDVSGWYFYVFIFLSSL